MIFQCIVMKQIEVFLGRGGSIQNPHALQDEENLQRLWVLV